MNALTGLLFTFALGLFILLGAFIVFATKNNNRFVEFSLAFAFGVMIMLIITDLLPEAYEAFGPSKIWLLLICIAGGILLLKGLDHFIPDHDDDLHTDRDDNQNLIHIGIISSIALVLHNIIEGMAVYTTTTNSLSLGLLISLGVGLHNIPLGMVITSAFLKAKQSKKKTIWILVGLSLSTFVGGLLLYFLPAHLFTEMVLGVLLALTLGMLIYISIFELLPKILHCKEKKVTILGVVLGVLLLAITILL